MHVVQRKYFFKVSSEIWETNASEGARRSVFRVLSVVSESYTIDCMDVNY